MRIPLALAVLGTLITFSSVRSAEGAPEIWLSPPKDKIFDMLDDPASWRNTTGVLTGVKIGIDVLPKADRGKLRQLAALVRQRDLQFTIECGGTLNHDWQDQAGELSARVELKKLRTWTEAGGRLDYLDVDGPVRRLLGYAAWGKDPDKKFTSIQRCAEELVDYIRAVRKEYPELQFFLLTNFPNWGYRGDVSYHARGPKRQDQGDYDEVVRTVLDVVEKAGLRLAGATVDNPYEYAVGVRGSATLEDPTAIDWITRIRAYEDFCRSRGLEFNFIVNSETGGARSDREFFEGTLKMVELYQAAGGRPKRYVIQSWYAYPKTIVPERAPFSMTALALEVAAGISSGKK